ncbi:hypothetical protein DRQ16_00325 [bacterium]|nr:MAG: hypothetical protein DRQ18_03625 [bacterium]RKZ24256.1 MAG: hypothetical protein DRQ16_00325 [bacterium]
MVILVLTPERDTDEAVERVKGEKDLLVLYVIEEELPESVGSWLMYAGFLGENPSLEVKRIIVDELERRAHERLEEIKKKLGDVEAVIEKGVLQEIMEKYCREKRPERFVIPKGEKIKTECKIEEV